MTARKCVCFDTNTHTHTDTNKQEGMEETKEEPKPQEGEVAVDEAIKSDDKFVAYTATYKKTLDSMAQLKASVDLRSSPAKLNGRTDRRAERRTDTHTRLRIHTH